MSVVYLSAARQSDLQGREAAGGVLRRAAGEVAARVRVLERRGRAAQQARAARLTRAAHRPVPAARARAQLRHGAALHAALGRALAVHYLLFGCSVFMRRFMITVVK